MTITLDGLDFELSDFVGTDGLGHTATQSATTGASGESYPAEPLFPDRVFRAALNQLGQGLRSTSTTSLSIGTGSKAFTLATSVQIADGAFVLATDQANDSNFMFGQVTSVAGLVYTVNVTDTGGSGTISAWNFQVSGIAGAAGTVPDGTISNAKLATMAANTVKVRAASTTGAPSDLALSASTILGRGSSGDIAALTLDDTLTLTGTVLGTNPLVLAPPTEADNYTAPANFAKYPDSTHALTGGRMYALPHFQANTDTATKIAIHVTTGHASNARLGIYRDSGGLPGERLLDAGTVDLSSTGLKTITISQALTPGKYWLAILPQSNGASVEGLGNGDLLPILGISNGGSGAAALPYIYRTFAYAALPDPFGSATRGGTGAPWIGLNFA